jgi:hypothetical protein
MTITTRKKINNRDSDGIREIYQSGSKSERQVVDFSVRQLHSKKVGVLPNLKKV